MKEKRSCKVISVVCQKGGSGKSASATQLAVGLVRRKHKVLLIDADPQGTGSMMLGVQEPDELDETITTVLTKIINEEPVSDTEALIRTEEGVDLLPANVDLAGMEATLMNTMNRERILKQYVDQQRKNYDYIILDCLPSLGMIAINALAASDSAIIPTLAEYPSARGLVQLLKTVNRVRKYINPKIQVEGILLTMMDERTNYNREIAKMVSDTYGSDIRVYKTPIPRAIRMAEAGGLGKSIFLHAPNSKAAKAYRALVKEVERDV